MTDAANQPASLWRRLLALLYDLLPLLALWFVAGILALLLTGGTFNPANRRHQYLIRALLLAVSAGYFVISWVRGGQTIGMRAWHLHLVGEDGRAMRWPRAMLRFAVALVSAAAFGAGFWWALFDSQSRTWHDIATESRMLRLIGN